MFKSEAEVRVTVPPLPEIELAVMSRTVMVEKSEKRLMEPPPSLALMEISRAEMKLVASRSMEPPIPLED